MTFHNGYYTYENFAAKHAFAARLFGVADTSQSESFAAIANAIGIDTQAIACVKQVHGTRVITVTKDMAGKGRIAEADAMISCDKGVALCVYTADCLPILFYDAKRQVIAAAHAGWKGVLRNIAAATVSQMCAEFACNPADISAAIGCHIGTCCFKVGDEVADLFAEEGYGAYIHKATDKPHVNLTSICKSQLTQAGIKSIHSNNVCSVCNSHIFYSNRGDGGVKGLMPAIIYNGFGNA